MLRTTVYVDEDVAVALRHRAALEGRTQAQLIRDALRKYVEETEIPEPPRIVGIGRHRSGRRDVSERAEQLLRRAARRRRGR
jgi:hypothetical protein